MPEQDVVRLNLGKCDELLYGKTFPTMLEGTA